MKFSERGNTLYLDILKFYLINFLGFQFSGKILKNNMHKRTLENRAKKRGQRGERVVRLLIATRTYICMYVCSISGD